MLLPICLQTDKHSNEPLPKVLLLLFQTLWVSPIRNAMLYPFLSLEFGGMQLICLRKHNERKISIWLEFRSCHSSIAVHQSCIHSTKLDLHRS